MPVLYIQRDGEKSKKLKSQMTDDMWRQVVIKYSDQDTYLELENKSKIEGVEDIVYFLEGQSPSIGKKFTNVRKAAQKAYKHALQTGDIKADKETITHRLAICSQCPFNKKRMFGATCMKCGCNIKLKTAVQTESCPIKKW